MMRAMFFFLTLLTATAVFAQEGEAPPGFAVGELLAIAFNSGIAMALVQILKTKVIPSLKANYPWVLPIISMVLGIASSYLLSQFGLDISAIVGAFSGFAASGMFAVVKEAKFLKVG